MMVEELTEEVINEFKKRACCLIPNEKSRNKGFIVTCHEYDFCGCEVEALINKIEELEKKLQEKK